MPQEFQVLQCYSCQTFQVHQVKKATKWACKMCGEKQSLKKVFGRGSGAECRQHVQRLNNMRAELDQKASSSRSFVQSDIETTGIDGIYGQNDPTYDQCDDIKQHTKETKWNMFVERKHIDGDSDGVERRHIDVDSDDEGDDRYTTDAQKFRQGRKRKRETKKDNHFHKRNEKWHQYTDGTRAVGLHDTYDMEKSMTKDGVFQTCQTRSSSYGMGCDETSVLGEKGRLEKENQPEHYFGNSSQRRIKCNTSELNPAPSQESFSSIPYDTCKEERIQLQSYCSRNFEVKRNESKNDKINTQLKTKWGVFTEADTCSQESSADNSQGPTDESYDTRPYVTFEPEETEPLRVPVFTNLGKIARTRPVVQSFENVCNPKANERFMGNSSKWTGFTTPEDNIEESDQKNTSKWTSFSTCENYDDQSMQNDTSKQTGFSMCENNIDQSGQKNTSKWSGFLASKNISKIDLNEKENDFLKQDLNYKLVAFRSRQSEVFRVDKKKSFPNISEPNGKLMLDNKITLQKPEENIKNFISNDKQGNHGNSESLRRNETLTSVFNAGELDDSDLEL